MLIERIRPKGFQRARNLRLRALEDAPDSFWVTAEEEAWTTAAEWRNRIARSDAATFVASRDGVDLGLVVGARHHDQEGDAGLYAMWVAPEARGNGVGSALIEAVVGWARAAGYRSLRLEVADANDHAVRLYERIGFPTDRTRRRAAAATPIPAVRSCPGALVLVGRGRALDDLHVAAEPAPERPLESCRCGPGR